MLLNLITARSVYVAMHLVFRSSEEIDLLDILRDYLPQMAPKAITIDLRNGHTVFLTEGGWLQQKILPYMRDALANRFKHEIETAHETVRTILA